MANPEILETLTQILRDLIFDESLVLTANTTRAEVPGWDSFAYVNFIVATEMHFAIRFNVAEVESFLTVGEIADRVATLVSK